MFTTVFRYIFPNKYITTHSISQPHVVGNHVHQFQKIKRWAIYNVAFFFFFFDMSTLKGEGEFELVISTS
jgi:hypothetical protein